MSLSLNYSLELDNLNGENCFFVDNTVDYGVNGNVNYSDIKVTRLVCTNWKGQQNPVNLGSGDALDQYRQYIKTNIGSSVYDNKTLVLSSFFIPFITSLTVLSGDTFETTGAFSKYLAPASYLPTNTFNVLILNSSYWGLTDSVFADMVYGLQYEVYVDTSPSTPSNVTNEKQYIIYGTTGTAVYNGNTYRIGEVFIATTNGSVSFTGNATLKILEASVNKYFNFVWPIKNRLYRLVLNEKCKCNPELITKIESLQLELQALDWANFTQWESITDAMNTISYIQEELTILERNT